MTLDSVGSSACGGLARDGTVQRRDQPENLEEVLRSLSLDGSQGCAARTVARAVDIPNTGYQKVTPLQYICQLEPSTVLLGREPWRFLAGRAQFSGCVGIPFRSEIGGRGGRGPPADWGTSG